MELNQNMLHRRASLWNVSIDKDFQQLWSFMNMFHRRTINNYKLYEYHYMHLCITSSGIIIHLQKFLISMNIDQWKTLYSYSYMYINNYIPIAMNIMTAYNTQ